MCYQMIIEDIQLLLKEHESKAIVFKIWYIKEYLQTIILKEIYEIPECKDLIFYWWTSLRFIFELNRLSEDLDFIWRWFSDFEIVAKHLQQIFWQYGVEITYKVQKFRIILNFKQLLDYFGLLYGNSKDLYIKIEISDDPTFCSHFDTKIYPVFRYNKSLVLKSMDISTLFASKLNAVLYRKREKQHGKDLVHVKWRDIYDLFRYLQKNIIPNIDCVKDVKDMKELKQKLRAVVEYVDFAEVILDLRNFLDDTTMLDFIKEHGKGYVFEKMEERND